mmetsp:Transcript_25699/g.52305  ORF Transcript_25699/g.52305 Transcript_25699/m.52305 type:complete len:440 (-) Transcript_25699:63-1382(-)
MISSSSSQRKKGGNEPWRNKERHYCPLCNAWMGSDRQSILLHENGKKHREAVEADLKRRRDEKSKKEKQERELEAVFRKVNEVAAGGTGAGEMGALAGAVGFARPAYFGGGVGSSSSSTSVPAGVPPVEIKRQLDKKQQSKPEAKTVKSETSDPKKMSSPVFDPTVGHYEHDGIIYLEGHIYADILEEGMPIQLWMGSPNATNDEKRDLRNFNYWKTALLAKVKKGKTKEETLCHVSYLSRPEDEDETIEPSVKPDRIRLILGSDPSIPSTMEEAHLALLGGEQIIHIAPGNNNASNKTDESTPEIDENTGFTSWNTVTIRKVSTHFEQVQERKRKRQLEQEMKERQERKEKEIQARKMEEAKYANAHDSALGAYDVWSSAGAGDAGGSKSYKGVDITKEVKVDVADTAKSLSKGMGSVAFKKKKKPRKNVRTTSADDD